MRWTRSGTSSPTTALTHRRNLSPPATGGSWCARTSRRFSTASATSAVSSSRWRTSPARWRSIAAATHCSNRSPRAPVRRSPISVRPSRRCSPILRWPRNTGTASPRSSTTKPPRCRRGSRRPLGTRRYAQGAVAVGGHVRRRPARRDPTSRGIRTRCLGARRRRRRARLAQRGQLFGRARDRAGCSARLRGFSCALRLR